MSIPFSRTTEYDGLVQLYENEIGVNYGDVSGNIEKLKEFTAQVNIAKRQYFNIAVEASGVWELDDSNNEDYATIYATLNAGQRDYTFVTDENGNLIHDIYKVLILPSATDTIYRELFPVDENQTENLAIIDESNTAGASTVYAKRANAIFLGGSIPNYTVARGIKVLVNREPSFYVYTDTTKKPGFPYYPEYFYLKPALVKARKASLAVLPRLEAEVLKLEGDNLTGKVGLIARKYGNRRKDETVELSGEYINSV